MPGPAPSPEVAAPAPARVEQAAVAPRAENKPNSADQQKNEAAARRLEARMAQQGVAPRDVIRQVAWVEKPDGTADLAWVYKNDKGKVVNTVPLKSVPATSGRSTRQPPQRPGIGQRIASAYNGLMRDNPGQDRFQLQEQQTQNTRQENGQRPANGRTGETPLNRRRGGQQEVGTQQASAPGGEAPRPPGDNPTSETNAPVQAEKQTNNTDVVVENGGDKPNTTPTITEQNAAAGRMESGAAASPAPGAEVTFQALSSAETPDYSKMTPAELAKAKTELTARLAVLGKQQTANVDQPPTTDSVAVAKEYYQTLNALNNISTVENASAATAQVPETAGQPLPGANAENTAKTSTAQPEATTDTTQAEAADDKTKTTEAEDPRAQEIAELKKMITVMTEQMAKMQATIDTLLQASEKQTVAVEQTSPEQFDPRKFSEMLLELVAALMATSIGEAQQAKQSADVTQPRVVVDATRDRAAIPIQKIEDVLNRYYPKPKENKDDADDDNNATAALKN